MLTQTIPIIAGVMLLAGSIVYAAPPAAQPGTASSETIEGRRKLMLPEEEKQTELSDLGPQIILQRYTRPRRFEVSLESQYYYNSNVLLADGEVVSSKRDSYWYEALNAAYNFPRLGALQSKLYGEYSFVRYNDQSRFDFDANAVGLNLIYPVKDWFVLYGDFNAERNYFRANQSEFYKAFDTRIGIWHHQPINNIMYCYVGYQFDWRVASPSELTRADNTLFTGVNITLLNRLSADLNYRLRVQEYLQADRSDLNNQISLSLTYSFTRYVSLVASISYADNDSNATFVDNNGNVVGRDYQVLNIGGGLSLRAKF